MDNSILAGTRIVGTHEGMGRTRVWYLSNGEYHTICTHGYPLTSLRQWIYGSGH